MTLRSAASGLRSAAGSSAAPAGNPTWTSETITEASFASVSGRVMMATVVSVEGVEIFLEVDHVPDVYISIVCLATAALTTAALVVACNTNGGFAQIYEASAGEGDDDDKIIVAKKTFGDFAIQPSVNDGTAITDVVEVEPTQRLPLGVMPAGTPVSVSLVVVSSESSSGNTTGITAEVGTIADADDVMRGVNILGVLGGASGGMPAATVGIEAGARELFLNITPTGPVAELTAIAFALTVTIEYLPA